MLELAGNAVLSTPRALTRATYRGGHYVANQKPSISHAYDPLTGSKHCPQCGERKPGAAFNRRDRHGRDPYAGYCRQCASARNAEYQTSQANKVRRRLLQRQSERRRGVKPKKIVVDAVAGTRLCPLCSEWKNQEHFFKTGYCHPCGIKDARERRRLPIPRERHRARAAIVRATPSGRQYLKAYNAARRLSAEFRKYERLKNAERRARKRGAPGRYDDEDIERIFNYQKGRCAVCSIKLDAARHIDHIKPLSKGGSNWPTNIQLLCVPCNLRKHATDPIVFMQRLGYLL
jgi:5-methylcytosine-specific restriction endonuclease McrA